MMGLETMGSKLLKLCRDIRKIGQHLYLVSNHYNTVYKRLKIGNPL